LKAFRINHSRVCRTFDDSHFNNSIENTP
jgi:hypothetical protein